MDKISLQIIIDKLTNISDLAYHETIDGVDTSFQIDSVIDELKTWLAYLQIGNSTQILLDGLCEALNSNDMDFIKGKLKSLINYIDFGYNDD